MAAVQQFLGAIEIGQNPVEKLGALDEAGFEAAPFGSGDQDRDGVEIPRAVHPQRVAVDVVGNAVLANALTGGLPAAGQFFRTQLGERGNVFFPIRTEFSDWDFISS